MDPNLKPLAELIENELGRGDDIRDLVENAIVDALNHYGSVSGEYYNSNTEHPLLKTARAAVKAYAKFLIYADVLLDPGRAQEQKYMAAQAWGRHKHAEVSNKAPLKIKRHK